MGASKIEWTEHVFNPVTGCTPVGDDCAHCYARVDHEKRARGQYPPWKTKPRQYEQPFNVIQCHPDRLSEPLHRRKPTVYFVNSGSDTFHSDIPPEFVRRIYQILEATPRHTYIVLTKRPGAMHALTVGGWNWCAEGPIPPPRNVVHGISAGNQALYDRRIRSFMRCPTVCRMLSLEPLLGPLDLREHIQAIDWVIVGCESGAAGRPMDLDWVRGIRDQCADAGVPFFFKQSKRDGVLVKMPALDGKQWGQRPKLLEEGCGLWDGSCATRTPERVPTT